MDDAELLQAARDWRDGILDGRPSEMMCAAICWPLAGWLNFCGVRTETVESDLGHMNHIWIKLADGRALDPTADQFNRLFPDMDLPPVYLGPPISIHGVG